MKLYRIPWPWDEHKNGALIVMAENKEQAITKATMVWEAMGREPSDDYNSAGFVGSVGSNDPMWDAIEEVAGSVVEAFGCDD